MGAIRVTHLLLKSQVLCSINNMELCCQVYKVFAVYLAVIRLISFNIGSRVCREVGPIMKMKFGRVKIELYNPELCSQINKYLQFAWLVFDLYFFTNPKKINQIFKKCTKKSIFLKQLSHN